ncbi:MAG: DUF1700 domain-containing protein [Turicibacter sp.]
MSEKVNWLEALEKNLRSLPFDDRVDVISNYKEQIQVMLNEGKSEEDILNQLGSPKAVAKEIKEGLGASNAFNFDHESMIENVKHNANSAINHLTDAMEGKTSDVKPVGHKILFIFIGLVFSIAALVIGSVGVSFIIAGLIGFFVSFLFIHLTYTLFFLGLSMGILSFNLGLLMIYVLVQAGKYMIKQLI